MHLSDLGIRALEPPKQGQKDYFDDTLAGFGIRLSQGGTRSFFLLLGTKQNRQRISIGRYGIITLSQARVEAKRLLAERTLGKIRPQTITYPQAAELFLEDKAKARRAGTVTEYQRLLKRIGFKGQLSDLTHDEVHRRLKRITHPSAYNHTLTALKVFLNWAQKRRYIEHNPTLGLSANQSTPRDRVLSDAELKSVWRACERIEVDAQLEATRVGIGPALPAHFTSIVKLLILTGQRRGEIAALKAGYIAGERLVSSVPHKHGKMGSTPVLATEQCTITFPPSLTKNGREHTIPIGLTATNLLSSLEANSGYLFPARGNPSSSFNGWSKAKGQLDELSGVEAWTLHDLRRTYATRMAELGVAPHVVERLLNHITGTISGVAAVYNRARYMDEMKIAVQLYEAHLSKVLGIE